MAGGLNFSYSKLGLYKECPQKYKFRYILKFPEKPKYYFAFGSALHKVMEFMYSAGYPPFPELEDVLKFFKAEWDSTSFEYKGYADAAKEKDGFLEGARIIKAFYEKHKNDNNPPLSTEYKSTVNIDGLSVISIVDRIDYLGGGRVSILDYKTGKTVAREPDQLLMYQKLMDNNPRLLEMIRRRDPAAKEAKISNMLFYYLPTLEEQYLQPAPKERIDDFWAGVLKVAADIMAAKFNPDPGESKCRFCDYRALCPVWAPSAKDEALADGAARNAAPAGPMEELSAKIDACGAALAAADKLKQEITAIMAKNNFTRHFGKNYAAELETINTLDFKDSQKTLELLKEFNLLPKVCVPTINSIQKLLESGVLDPRQKQAFDALTRKQSEKRLKINKTED